MIVLGSILLLGIPILAVDLHRQKLTVPLISKLYASATAKLLPVNIVSESQKYSLNQPRKCPPKAFCNNLNEVLSCSKTYKKVNQIKSDYKSDTLFGIHNKLAYTGYKLYKLLGRYPPADQYTHQYIAAHEQNGRRIYFHKYRTQQCVRATKETK